MATELEKKVKKIFTELYEGYEKGNNWYKAMNEVNSIVKKLQEESSKKLKYDRRTLIYEIDVSKKNVKTLQRELSIYKKVKIPNLQREVLRLQQIINKQNGSN